VRGNSSILGKDQSLEGDQKEALRYNQQSPFAQRVPKGLTRVGVLSDKASRLQVALFMGGSSYRKSVYSAFQVNKPRFRGCCVPIGVNLS